MIKEKEKYFYSNMKQQKITNKLTQGYRIKNSNSQVFDDPIGGNPEYEEGKNELSRIDDSSHYSSGRHNSHFMSPESRNELQSELRSIHHDSDNLDKKDKQKKVVFSEEGPDIMHQEARSPEKELKSDHSRLKKMKELVEDDKIYNEERPVEEMLTLMKSRSENKVNKSIREEIEEYAYNTHADEYIRQQEIDSWSKRKQELYHNLDNLIDFHVDEIIDDAFMEKELQEIFNSDERDDAQDIWKDRFKEFTLKAIRLVKPSQRLMKDTMDINDYVTIELIDHEDDTKCKYINGCVIKNNIADRRMKSEINNPKILLIGNSIGICQEESCADIETYVSQEKHYIDILMDRLNQVNPNVILIENDISRSVLSKIRELNITVVTNVKRKNIEKIARCTETLIIPSVNLIEKHLSLGSCKKFYLKLGQCKTIKENSKIMSITQSLIYFDGCKPWYGSTI